MLILKLHTEKAALTDNDEIHVSQARNGSKTAFAELYKNNVGRVYAVSLRLSGDPLSAEEITQDVFVKAWENLTSFKGESKFSTWLFRIAVNTSLVRLRTDKRRFLRFAYTAEILKPFKRTEQDPGSKVDLEQAILSLPDKARQIFVLHDIEGYKHDEIADMMNISSGTTKAQLHRARKLLREALER